MAVSRRKDARERISVIAQRWFLIEPLLFSVYCTHELSENVRLGLPFRTGKGRIEFNPKLIDDIIDNLALENYLKLEALRILLKHPYQRQPYRARPEILYLASNMTILDNMGKAVFLFELVPDWIEEKMPPGKTFEEYYGLLNRLLPPELSQTNNGEESGFGVAAEKSGVNDENSDDSSAGSSPGLEKNVAQWKEGTALWAEDSLTESEMNILIRNVIESSKKSWGTIPGSFVEVIKASLAPPLNIVNLLKGFKKSILSQRRDLTRMRPSRRYGFEQMGSKYAYTTNVLVALDVSGSVSNDMLSRMLGMINRVFKQGVEHIDVIQFDAELKGRPTPIKKIIKKVKVLGRGGTDFQPAADFYFAHPEYDGLIYITDGIAPDPEVPVEFRQRTVAWIIVEDDLSPIIRHGWTSS